MPQMASFKFLRFCLPSMLHCCWNSAVAVVTTSRDEQPTIRGSILGTGDFSFLRRVQTDYGVHPASYPIPAGGGEQSRREPDHLPPSSSEVTNEWSHTSIPTIQPSSSTSQHGIMHLAANLQQQFFF
jgi:hypothetical protein